MLMSPPGHGSEHMRQSRSARRVVCVSFISFISLLQVCDGRRRPALSLGAHRIQVPRLHGKAWALREQYPVALLARGLKSLRPVKSW
jgi:hypothetical protein